MISFHPVHERMSGGLNVLTLLFFYYFMDRDKNFRTEDGFLQKNG
jgi:hypothetical protein